MRPDPSNRRPEPWGGLFAALALLLCFGVFLAACGSDESREDANDVGNGQVEKSTPAIVAFNNHFPNVQTKCDGFGHRIYVTSSDSILVIPDGTCQGPGTSYDDLLRANEQPTTGEPSTDPRDYYPPVGTGSTWP
jgi:hypothetical protein